jgi:hypothetical protein
MPRDRKGNTLQTGLYYHPGDFSHQHMPNSVLGIVLNVYCSDSSQNESAIVRGDLRGFQCECRVLVVNDGRDATWILPNVVVPPRGSTGIDNYYEELPTPTTCMVDGSDYDTQGRRMDITKMDGDYCIVDFIGGSIEQPFLVSWWPHPSNRFDPATSDAAGDGSVLNQGKRLVRRFQGSKFQITDKGSIFIDTSEAASTLQFGESTTSQPIKRVLSEDGGDVQLDIKSSKQMQVNFNPPIPLPKSQPSLLQPNSTNTPKNDDAQARSKDFSAFTMDKDFIEMIAGQFIRLLALTSDIEITPKGNIYLGDSTAAENFVLGQAWKAMMESLLDGINAITVPTGMGPSGTPINAPTFSAIKAALDDQLSKFIFGQENSPTPTP